MSSKVFNQGPYLRTSRDFPEEPQSLRMELIKQYNDVANAVNARTIGLFPVGGIAINGEEWFLTGQKQQGQRQVYTFTAAGNIAHGLKLGNISKIVRIYGAFTDGTNWYPLPYVDATAANNQVSVKVTSTNIVITAGGGSPPSITSGTVVLEWISQV